MKVMKFKSLKDGGRKRSAWVTVLHSDQLVE